MNLVDLPWERIVDGRCVHLVERATPPRHQKYLALSVMRDVERISAEFDGCGGLYATVLMLLLIAPAHATGIAILGLEERDPELENKGPRFCVRRARWQPPVDTSERSSHRIVGSLEGISSLQCEIAFPLGQDSAIGDCVSSAAALFRHGLQLSPCERLRSRWSNIECTVFDAPVTYSVSYGTWRRKNPDLEDVSVKALELADEVFSGPTRVPDECYGCRVSYGMGAAEGVSFALENMSRTEPAEDDREGA